MSTDKSFIITKKQLTLKLLTYDTNNIMSVLICKIVHIIMFYFS